MSNMPWKEAIISVLKESADAMHYSEIAEKIIEKGLRTSVGATPASSVATYISTSLNDPSGVSEFIRVGRGQYALRSKYLETKEQNTVSFEEDTPDIDEAETQVVHAFGMFWQRELILWSSNPSLLGRQQIGADAVDFSSQLGVYLLHDGREVVYVGRSVDRPLGKRMYEHTQDRLRGRWNRFSWFGLLTVTEDGSLEETAINPSAEIIIATLEAVLIEGLEPPQNRKRGDNFNAIEYLQAEDPEIEKQQMKTLLSEMQSKLEKS